MDVSSRGVRELAKKGIGVFVCIAALLLIAFPPALDAQVEPELRVLHFDVTPYVGYRTSMSVSVEPHVTGMNPRVVLDSNPSYGASFGVRLRNEDDLVEIRWARQDSYVHTEDIMPSLPRRRVQARDTI